ncbi:MAG: amidohydrolase family protein [Deltaproteobacteria bacterium]|nr:amidohydrolase family protein [Deltaproteobacteria bacterium]
MGELLKGGTLVDLAEPLVVREDLRVDGGAIVARGPELVPEPGERVTDLAGKLVMGGLVAAHTHLYATLARGLPAPTPRPKSLLERLERETWKLDRALDLETVALSAQVGAAEALRCGVTTLVDHHSSPSFIEGSLDAVREGVNRVGLRAALCCEVSDRHGTASRASALRETERFLGSAPSGRFLGMVGGHASFTMENETLESLGGLAKAFGAGLHLHVAESLEDEQQSVRRFEQGIVARLEKADLLGPHTLLAHCIHLEWGDFSKLQTHGSWLVHCARSDMERCAGYAPAGKFGARKALGIDGLGGDILAEGQAAFLRGQEAGFDIDITRWHAGGQALASDLFGMPLGPLRPGAAADLVVLDYPCLTPLASETLPGHLALGITSSHVDAVMVDGAWRLWAREILSFDEAELRAKAEASARTLWSRMREL